MINRRTRQGTPDSANEMREQSDTERRFHAALRTASNILGYAECSPARLREKLASRGYEPALIADVLDRLRGAGLLDEDGMAARRAEYLYRVKGYGPRRILPELRRLGFSSDAVSGVEFPEETFDFVSRCAALLRKRSDIDEKAIAALVRYGYTSSHIKQAIAQIRAEEEEDE